MFYTTATYSIPAMTVLPLHLPYQCYGVVQTRPDYWVPAGFVQLPTERCYSQFLVAVYAPPESLQMENIQAFRGKYSNKYFLLK